MVLFTPPSQVSLEFVVSSGTGSEYWYRSHTVREPVSGTYLRVVVLLSVVRGES